MTLPTGIIITQLAHDVALVPVLKRTFGWLLSLAEPKLTDDIELLVRYGGELWERASAEVNSVLSSMGNEVLEAAGTDDAGSAISAGI